MTPFLQRLLKVHTFEEMQIPLAIVASDLVTGDSAVFRGKGDALLPIRASCAYPGMFPPIRLDGRVLVDGMVTMDVPAPPLRTMGATHVIAISLPSPAAAFDPQDMLSVVSRSFQILTQRTESQWRRSADLVLSPDVRNMGWDGFDNADKMIEAGEKAARAALPVINRWFAEAKTGDPITPSAVSTDARKPRISLRIDD
jgi:NTE family protein